MITEPYNRLQICTKLYNFMKSSHFSEGKTLFHRQFAFSIIQTVQCIHNIIFIVYITTVLSSLYPNIEYKWLFKMIPNMNGFVNWLLRKYLVTHFPNDLRITSNTFDVQGCMLSLP